MNRLLVIVVVLIFWCKNLCAQDFSDERVNKFLANMDMTFHMPKDYIAQKTDFYFGCDAFLSAPIHYTILHKNKNIVIGIYFASYPSREELNRIHAEQPVFHKKRGFEPDSNYIYGAKAMADTIHHKIIYLPRKYVWLHNYADRGAIYVRNCQTPLYLVGDHNDLRVITDYTLKKEGTKKTIVRTYKHNKVVTLSKDGRGHIELVYLYTDDVSEKQIEQEMQANAKMLQFNF